jgi:hypothetical protein
MSSAAGAFSDPKKDEKEVGLVKANRLIGVALIALGIAVFVCQGITYTTREKAVDLGPIQVTTEQTRTIPLSPIMGSVALAGGVLLLLFEARR